MVTMLDHAFIIKTWLSRAGALAMHCPLSTVSCVCVCVQLVMRTKPGALEERICPWARYVTRPKDVPIFEQTFWDPPQEQVCWSRCFAEPVCCLPVISYQRSC